MPRKFGQAKLDSFKKAFNDRKVKLLESLKQNASQELDVDGDDIDLIQGAAISEITQKLSKRDLLALEKLDLALERIDAGIFGICAECEAAIGEKRLLAMPGCDLCIVCAEEEERQAKQFSVR